MQRLGKVFLAKFRKWASKGNPNVGHHVAFINTEAAALAGKDEDAKKYFEEGLLLSSGRGFTNSLALGHERFGLFYLKRNQHDEGTMHIRCAIEQYESRGATARRDALRAEFSHLPLVSPPPLKSTWHTNH